MPPGRRTRRNSAKARSRSGMWWRTAWPKTRSKLASANGSVSASARTVSTSSPSSAALRASGVEHAGRDVGRGRAAGQPELQEVEREVAGPGADLQRVGERGLGSAPSALVELRRAPAPGRPGRSRCPTWSRTRRRPRRGSGC